MIFHVLIFAVISTTMLVLGPGSTHLVTAANLWPRYDHIERCVAVHLQQSDLGPHCLQKWLLKSQADDKADDNSCDWRFMG